MLGTATGHGGAVAGVDVMELWTSGQLGGDATTNASGVCDIGLAATGRTPATYLTLTAGQTLTGIDETLPTQP